MAQEWYCRIAGKQYGPMSPKQLKSLAASGKLKPDDGVRREADKQWAAASKVKGLFSADAAEQKTSTPKAKPSGATSAPVKKATPKPAAKIPRAKPIEPESPPDDDDDDFQLAPLEPLPSQAETPAAAARPVGAKAPVARAAASQQPAEHQQEEAFGPPSSGDSLKFAHAITTAGSAAAIGFATICLAMLPILPLLCGVLGIIFAFRAFAMARWDRNVLGLSLVGAILSLVGLFWGLQTTLNDPSRIQTIQQVFGIIPPVEKDVDLEATKEVGTLGDVEVTVSKIGIGPAPGVRDSRFYILVQLKLTNSSPSETVNYTSWSHAESGAALRNSKGDAYSLIRSDRVAGQLSGTTEIPPGASKVDILVFDTEGKLPAGPRLTLSGRAIAKPDEQLHFKILPESIAAMRPPSAKPKKSKRAKTTVEVGPESE